MEKLRKHIAFLETDYKELTGTTDPIVDTKLMTIEGIPIQNMQKQDSISGKYTTDRPLPDFMNSPRGDNSLLGTR